MKILTKLLNAVVAILVLIGIFSVFYYFISIRPKNADYDELLSNNEQLTEKIDSNNVLVRTLEDSITIKDAEIRWTSERIGELESDISKIEKERDKEIEKLKDLSLEEILDIIIDYYGSDTTEISIETSNNEIRVVISSRIAREVSETIVKLKSIEIELNMYKKQATLFDSLSCKFISKIELLEAKDSVKQNTIDTQKKQNTGLQDTIDNRNKKIKSIKATRNLIDGVLVVVLVLSLI